MKERRKEEFKFDSPEAQKPTRVEILRERRIGCLKTVGLIATPLGGTIALLYSDNEKIRLLGALVVVGCVATPGITILKQEVNYFLGKDISDNQLT